MTDREKVIGLLLETAEYFRECRNNASFASKAENHFWELQNAANEVAELIKEQEPRKPHYNARTGWYECGACNYSMTSWMHCRSELIPAYKVGFCAKCGKAVKWE